METSQLRLIVLGNGAAPVGAVARRLTQLGATVGSSASKDTDVAVVVLAGSQHSAPPAAARGLPRLGVVDPVSLELDDLDHAFDDFVVWPCDPRELGARVVRLARRHRSRNATDVLRTGHLVVDPDHHEVSLGGRTVAVTYMEFQLLRYLLENRGRPVPRDRLYRAVWGMTHLGGVRTVDVHVRRLRQKLGPAFAPMLETIRKVGYRLVDSPVPVDVDSGSLGGAGGGEVP